MRTVDELGAFVTSENAGPILLTLTEPAPAPGSADRRAAR
jgi:hypothetical protein